MDVPQTEYRGKTPVLKKDLIGKTVVDAYGRRLGKVLGFSTDSQQHLTALGIERTDGGFLKCNAADVILDQDLLKIDGSWRRKAESLTNEVALTLKKIEALNELESDADVSKTVFATLQNGFEAEKKALLDRRRDLKDRLKERLDAVQVQLKDVYEFITYVKISYHIGDMDEDAYQRSHIPFQLMIDKLLAEEEDLKFALNLVATNTATLPPEPLLPLPASEPQLHPIKLRIRTDDSL